MKVSRVWIPIAAVGSIGAGLVILYLQATDNTVLDSPTASAETKNEAVIARGRPAFTPFESPWQLPELRFINRKDREITLEAFRGSHVLLNVWATWCAPCREEMPALDRLQELMGGPDFLVLPLSIDEARPAVIRKFYEDFGIGSLYVYQDPTGSAFAKLNLPAIPASILLNRDGKGIAYAVGPVEWDNPDIVREIKNYLSN